MIERHLYHYNMRSGRESDKDEQKNSLQMLLYYIYDVFVEMTSKGSTCITWYDVLVETIETNEHGGCVCDVG